MECTGIILFFSGIYTAGKATDIVWPGHGNNWPAAHILSFLWASVCLCLDTRTQWDPLAQLGPPVIMDVQMSFPLSPRPFDHVIMWFLGKRRTKKNKEKNMRMYRTFCTEDTGKVLFNFKVLRKDIFHVFEPDLSFSPNFLLGPPFPPSSITLCGKVGHKNRPEKKVFFHYFSLRRSGAPILLVNKAF